MTLDRYMDDFARDLARATRTRRRRRRTRLALALPAAAALAAAVALLPGADGDVDAIAEAREALSPSGEVVHMVVRTRFGTRGQAARMEQWYAADPARWRIVQEFPLSPERQFQMAYARDRVRAYDPRRDVVRIFPSRPVLGMTAPGVLGGDPASELRTLLAAGNVRDDGVVTVDGRSVRRLVTEDSRVGPSRQLVYYMDPQTFAPVGGRLYFISKGRRTRPFEFTVERYERLPLNAETEQLLRISKTPDTKFVWRVKRR